MDMLSKLAIVRRKGRSLLKPGLRGSLLAGLFAAAILGGVTSAETNTSARYLTPERRVQIESTLTLELQSQLNQMKRTEGQLQALTVKVKFDPTGEYLIIDPGKGFLDTTIPYISSDMENQMQQLASTATFLLDGIVKVRGTQFRFDGKDIYYYFPSEWRPNPPSRTTPADRKTPADKGVQSDKVVISAGHGLVFYYTTRGGGWKEQRPFVNGIREDYITPFHALDLDTWMIVRSNAETVFTRSQSSEIHEPSGEEWWKVAARGHLEQIYPDQPDIWNSLRNSPSFNRRLDRQELEDIRARPRFANFIDADTLISLHTNGHNTNPAIRGTEVYTYAGRADDLALGDSILCYMKELIQAQVGYETFPVRTAANNGIDHGENRLAEMPAVIVEIAYHSNAEDALALQDPVFRDAAMKGIEKGYRLHEEGEPCDPFGISNIPDTTGPQNMPVPVEVHYVGYPQFAVKATVEVVNCPSSWNCVDFERTIADSVPSPLTYTVRCNAPSPRPSATFRLRTTLSDADEVTSDPVEHNFTCTPAAGSAPENAPADGPSMSIVPS